MLSIRKATEKDFGALELLHGFNWVTQYQINAAIGNNVLVAILDGKIVGSISCLNHTIVQLGKNVYSGRGLRTAGEAQGKGIGSRLLQEAAKLGKKLGHSRMYTQVHQRNSASIACHVKAGYKKYRKKYEPYNDFIFYYNTHAIN